MQIREELEESARVHGASFWQTLRRVVVPLARPGVTSSMILLFILSVRELGSSIFLVTSDSIVMSVETVFLWEGGRWGYTAALAIVQSVLLFIGVAIFRKVLRGEIKAE
ncbi:MAG: ABC transporter permease subunit [Chloroflexi bacterium]|nr:ABC transporter permease subunit [Chloroflexota bacterium]